MAAATAANIFQGADQIEQGKFDLVVLYSGVRWKVWLLMCLVLRGMARADLAQSLVKSGACGLRGVAGDGLTHWANFIHLVCWPQFSLGLGAPFDKLGLVKVTTLAGLFIVWRAVTG